MYERRIGFGHGSTKRSERHYSFTSRIKQRISPDEKEDICLPSRRTQRDEGHRNGDTFNNLSRTMFGLLLIFAFVYAFAWIVYRRYFFFPRIQFEDLRGRRVIITGASRGIGEELAYEYSRYQCRLLLAARSFDVLEDRVARRCRELGATSVQCLKFDAAKEEDSRKLIERANECYGGIDILLLNHTASVYRPFLRHDRRQNIDEMINLMQTNFFGYFYSSSNIQHKSNNNNSFFLSFSV